MPSRANRSPKHAHRALVGVSAVAVGALLSTYAGALRSFSYARAVSPTAACSAGATPVGDDTALQAAVLASRDDSVICITADITVSQTLVLDDTSVTFEGSGSVSLSGAGARRIIDADFTTGGGEDDTLTIRDLTLTQGFINDSTYGGAVRVEGDADRSDALVMTGATITESYSDYGAGGVSARGLGSVSIAQTTFTDDSTGGVLAAGGALDVTSTSRTAITDTRFEDNYSKGWGGAAWLYNSGVTTLDGTYFQRNRSIRNAGALYVTVVTPTSSQEISLTDSTFADNTSSNVGGAMRIRGNDDTVTFTSVDFVRNTASGDGGALNISNQSGPVDLDTVSFSGNQSGGSGGAVRMETLSAPLSFTRVDSDANHAQSDGGAMKVTSGSLIDLTDSTFNDDTAVVDGGAVYFRSTEDMYIARVAVQDSITGDDGAMYLRSDDSTVASASVLMLDTTFTGNRSTGNLSHGGGLTLFNLHQARILSSDFTDNVTDSHVGAGLYAGQIDLVAVSSDFTRNSAGFDGGAIYAQSSRMLLVEGGTFSSNSASRSGGAIFARYIDTVGATYPDMQGNSAGGDGGAIYAKEAKTTAVLYANFIGNYASGDGGAIYLESNDYLDDTTILTDVTFQDDSTGVDGGAISALVTGRIEISDVTASGTQSVGDGGFAHLTSDDSSVTTSQFILDGVTLTGHQADNGGALLVKDANSLTVRDSSVTNSSALRDGGAILAGDMRSVYVQGSTISGNSAGVLTGGIATARVDDTVSISDSTISGNSSLMRGAAVEVLMYGPGNVDIRNTTVVGNSVTGGMLAYGNVGILGVSGSTGTLDFVTITGNDGTTGGGLNVGGGIAVTAENSIIAGNSGGGGDVDMYLQAPSTFTANYSLFTSAASVIGTTITGNGNVFGAPKLNGLDDNGGPTKTMLPQWDSPAVKTGDPNWTAPPTDDQRGSGFPRDAGGRVNMGAIQGASAQPPAPTYPPSAPREVTAVAGDQQAVVSWQAPASNGSFPITDYQIDDSTGTVSTLIKVSPGQPLAATIEQLANGTEYSFRVRALNGAGWGPWSGYSNPVVPAPEAAILITGSRDGRYVKVKGTSTGIDGQSLVPRIRFPGPKGYKDGRSRPTVNAEGDFTWQRQTGKKTYVYFLAEDLELRSNRVVIPAKE